MDTYTLALLRRSNSAWIFQNSVTSDVGAQRHLVRTNWNWTKNGELIILAEVTDSYDYHHCHAPYYMLSTST